jgi:hypothetical protein
VRKSTKRTLPFLDTSVEAFRILAKEAGMRAIDLTPELRRRAARGEALYHPFDSHWNSAGRRAAAETIALALED